MIISPAKLQLAANIVYPLSYPAKLPEIKRRTFHPRQLSQGYLHLIDRQIARTVYLQLVIENGRPCVARKIEIGMLGKIYKRKTIAHSLIGHFQHVVVAESICNGKEQVAGKTLVRMGAYR